MTSPTAAVSVHLEHEGQVSQAERDYAHTRIGAVLRYARDPVLHARVRLTRLADPALERPAIAQANLDLNGRLLRAQVARPTMQEAIDEVHDRLQAQIGRAGKDWEEIRGRRPSGEPGEWRHTGVPRQQTPYFPRPAEEREITRHKAFGLPRLTLDEAAFDMEMLDYGFHLFTEEGSGVDSVLYRTDDGVGYRLAQVTPNPDAVAFGATNCTVSSAAAPRLSVPEAVERLTVTGWPFVFFADADTGRGCVLYLRYDGHYGLVTPAG